MSEKNNIPINQAAQLIVSAQAAIRDLDVQARELQAARAGQQSLIESLMPVATWGEPESVVDEPEEVNAHG